MEHVSGGAKVTQSALVGSGAAPPVAEQPALLPPTTLPANRDGKEFLNFILCQRDLHMFMCIMLCTMYLFEFWYLLLIKLIKIRFFSSGS